MKSLLKCVLMGAMSFAGLGALAGEGNSATADLIHRWSFNGNLTDSVGGKTATLGGTATYNTDSNSVVCTGTANNTSYIALGTGLVPTTSSPITIEIWATQNATKNWARIFDFGSDNKNYLLMSWTQSSTLTTDRVEIDKGGTVYVKGDNTMQPYTLNTEYHISLTLTPQSDGKTKLAWAKRDVATGAVLKSGSGTTSAAWDPSAIAAYANCWLGRSQYTSDCDASATYNEVRIWKSAMTTDQLNWSAILGPNLLPVAETDTGTATLTLTNVNGQVSVNGAADMGTGSVTVPRSYNVSLEAHPAEGYTFCYWSGDTKYITTGSTTSSNITVCTSANVALTPVFDVAKPVYARYKDGGFAYLSALKGPVDAPAEGMSTNITVLFSTDAEYQGLCLISNEVKKAKALQLETHAKLTADADWTTLDYSLAGYSVDLNGKRLTIGSLTGTGGYFSDGNMVANGTFEANSIASGAWVQMTPNGWRTSGTVGLIKNHSGYGASECNGSNWCRICNGGQIYREFTIAQEGTYTLAFSVASVNNSGSYWNSGVYAGVDGNNVINQRTGSWNASWKSFNISLKTGVHTLRIGCNANSAILLDNVVFYKSSSATQTGVLEVKVPEGKTLTDGSVLFGGGQALQLWKSGKGTLQMTKQNNGFGSSNGYVSMVVKDGIVQKKEPSAGTPTCGPQYCTIQVDDGGTLDVNGRSYWDYNYILNGAGYDNLGALRNTGWVSDPWTNGSYGYVRNINLGSDTTIKGSQSFGMSFWQYSATTMALNGHTLHYGGTAIYFGNMSYSGTGTVVIDNGCTMEAYVSSPTLANCTLQVDGQLQQHDVALGTIKNLIFTETGKFCNGWDTRPAFTVSHSYAPNLNVPSNSKVQHPTLTLGTASSLYTTLDLSRFSDTFNSSSTTFYANSVVTVELGDRELADQQKLVSWTTVPSVLDWIGSGTNLGNLRLLAKSDGLYVIAAPAWAEWDVTNGCWKFFRADGTAYTDTWEDGVTSEIDVHFSSYAEYAAITAQNVTPAKYVMTAFTATPGAQLQDFTTGFDFVIKPGMVVDLKGNRVKLPAKFIGGAVPFTVTDTGSVAAPSQLSSACFWLDAMDTSTLTLSGNSVQKWTSKDANHVVATATSSPTYKTYLTANGFIPTVDFGAIGSNLDMSYTRFTNLRTVFWVMKIAKGEGAFFLGDMTTYQFHRGSAGQYGNNSYHKYSSMWKGTTAVNVGSDYPPDTEFCVYSATMSQNVNSDRLTTDRTCKSGSVTRTGGRQLSELICFSSVLSDADRTAIVNYLQQKWFGSSGRGQLIIDVPSGTSIANSNVTIQGGVRVVKQGAGTYTASKTNPYYGGGTEVAAGTFTIGNSTCMGSVGSEVQVDTDATFELNGVAGLDAYTFVLAGGTMQNTKADVGEGSHQLSKMRLTADSTFKPTYNYGFIGPSYAATSLDLAGHTLTVPIGTSGKYFWLFNTTVTAGTIDITSGGWLKVDKTAVNAGSTTFRTACALNINVPFTVGGYEARYGGAAYNAGTTLMTVNKTFKPANACYRGSIIKDGVTLDLSQFSGVLTGTSAFTATPNTLVYPTNATLQVELHGRALTSPKIIGWETTNAPNNVTFVPTEQTHRDGRMLVTKDDGVYVVGGTVIFFR